MTLRISTGLRNHLLSGGSLKDALNNGRIEIYSGSQPASADAAVSGTLLVTITKSSGAWTAETPSTGSIELTGGSSGSVNDVTVDSVSILDATVPYNTSLAQTAADLAAALNRSATNLDWLASASGAVVTLTTHPQRGAKYASSTLASSTTTLTKTDTSPTGGVAAVNGLQFEDAGSGAMTKRTGHTWTGVAAASGTAGWFRAYGPHTDAGGADSAGTKLRIDGAISTSGAELSMSPTSITSGATQTVNTFSPSVPAST